jgi:predicted secreted Zn-dependent protease
MFFDLLVRQQRRRRRKSCRLNMAMTRMTIDYVWPQQGTISSGEVVRRSPGQMGRHCHDTLQGLAAQATAPR